MPTPHVLVFGATGNVGRHLVPLLLGRGARVRAVSRDADRARGALPSHDALGIAEADLTDVAALPSLFEGVDRVYLATNGEDQLEAERNAIDAAAKAGVARLVKVSVIGTDPDHFVSLARHHHAIERHLAASGVPAVVLRPNWFTDNFLGVADTISQGAVYGSAGDGRVGFVDARDVAAVASYALLADGPESEYVVTGPTALTFAEAAEAIGRGIGRDVSYVDLPEGDFRGALEGAGLPGGVVDIVLEINRNAREGNLDVASDAVERTAGRPARTVEEYARDHRGVIAV